MLDSFHSLIGFLLHSSSPRGWTACPGVSVAMRGFGTHAWRRAPCCSPVHRDFLNHACSSGAGSASPAAAKRQVSAKHRPAPACLAWCRQVLQVQLQFEAAVLHRGRGCADSFMAPLSLRLFPCDPCCWSLAPACCSKFQKDKLKRK